MQDILKPDLDLSMGGILKMWFADVNIVETFPRIENMKFKSQLTLESPNTWTEFYFTPETGSLDVSFNGNYNIIQVSGFFPQQYSAVISRFKAMSAMQFVVVVQDNNDQFYAVGSPDNPAQFTYNFKSQKTPSSRAGFEFVFSCNSLLSPIMMRETSIS